MILYLHTRPTKSATNPQPDRAHPKTGDSLHLFEIQEAPCDYGNNNAFKGSTATLKNQYNRKALTATSTENSRPTATTPTRRNSAALKVASVR